MVKHYEGYSVLVDVDNEEGLCVLITEDKDGVFEHDLFDIEVEYTDVAKPLQNVLE